MYGHVLIRTIFQSIQRRSPPNVHYNANTPLHSYTVLKSDFLFVSGNSQAPSSSKTPKRTSRETTTQPLASQSLHRDSLSPHPPLVPSCLRHFSPLGIRVTSVAAWGMAFLLAAVPLLPTLQPWTVFGDSAYCLPVVAAGPISPGHAFFLAVVVIPKLVFACILGAALMLLYLSVRREISSLEEFSMPPKDVSKSLRICKLVLLEVAVWLVTGVLGVRLWIGGLSSEVRVATTVFLLPLPAALNPWVYVWTVVSEHRQKQKVERIQKFIVSGVKGVGRMDKM